MCLILFAWRAHPRYPLVLAANRDEFHDRPTEKAGFWADRPGLLAGRDLQAGGTWLGISRTGRFAAVTNYREPQAPEPPLDHSRGHLVSDFVDADARPLEYGKDVLGRGFAYRGFNLLLGSPRELVYASNRADAMVAVEPGSHGLSNHLLDTHWPKVTAGRRQLESLLASDRLEPEAFLELLTDRTLTPGEMPQNGADSDLPEQLARHYFIVSPVYGTRSSTVVLMGRDGRVRFVERQFGPSGIATFTTEYEFRIEGVTP
jgi:uncharacterized protein with NRDE domain